MIYCRLTLEYDKSCTLILGGEDIADIGRQIVQYIKLDDTGRYSSFETDSELRNTIKYFDCIFYEKNDIIDVDTLLVKYTYTDENGYRHIASKYLVYNEITETSFCEYLLN